MCMYKVLNVLCELASQHAPIETSTGSNTWFKFNMHGQLGRAA